MDGNFGNSSLSVKYKKYTIDPGTRYTRISNKIDHERTLKMYDTDVPEDYEKLKKSFNQIENFSMD